MDIIYLKAPAPPVATPVQTPVDESNKTARQGGGGAKKRTGGFTMALPNTVAAALPATVSPANDTPIQATLRARYGSHMDVVQLGLTVWQEIGLLYAEWREPWTYPGRLAQQSTVRCERFCSSGALSV